MLDKREITSVVAERLREAPETSATAAPAASLTDGLRPEAKLLLLCARTQADGKTAEEIKTILRRDLDWEYIVSQAHQQCVSPLVYQTLDNVCRLGVPKESFARLRGLVQANTRFNLYRTGELIKILRLLNFRGISAVPFKGPVLSVLAYGSLALREYADLDLLVRPADVAKTKDLLVENGYQLVTSLKRSQTNRTFQPRNKDLIFENASRSVRLELHWRLTGRHFNFPLDLDRLWDRLETVTLAGVAVLTLGPEDLLLYLCMHGSRHGWERLQWICDIAEVIRGRERVFWDQVISQAGLLGCERMLGLGLLLAHDLLAAELPDDVKQHIRKDTQLLSLTTQLRESLFQGLDATADISYWYDFQLRVRERVRDRLRLHLHYYGRYLRLAVMPNERDRALLELPTSLSFLYYLLRPLRLVRSFAVPKITKR